MHVQKAAISALAELEDDVGLEIVPYLDLVVRHLTLAFDKYEGENLLILYDAIKTLGDAVGVELQNSTYAESLMPPLLKRWSMHEDDVNTLLPLLQVRQSSCVKKPKLTCGIVSGLHRTCNWARIPSVRWSNRRLVSNHRVAQIS